MNEIEALEDELESLEDELESLEDDEFFWEVWDSNNPSIVKFNSFNDTVRYISDKIKESGFKSYYWRGVAFEDYVMVDYGSHSHFFYYKLVLK